MAQYYSSCVYKKLRSPAGDYHPQCLSIFPTSYKLFASEKHIFRHQDLLAEPLLIESYSTLQDDDLYQLQPSR